MAKCYEFDRSEVITEHHKYNSSHSLRIFSCGLATSQENAFFSHDWIVFKSRWKQFKRNTFSLIWIAQHTYATPLCVIHVTSKWRFVIHTNGLWQWGEFYKIKNSREFFLLACWNKWKWRMNKQHSWQTNVLMDTFGFWQLIRFLNFMSQTKNQWIFDERWVSSDERSKQGELPELYGIWLKNAQCTSVDLVVVAIAWKPFSNKESFE